MSPNSLLRKLGFSNNERAVIFHADDINMSQSSLDAYIDLAQQKFISSAAAMVPCPWFPALAKHNSIHPAKDSPELRAIAPDWRSWVADYELFMSDAWHKAVESSGVKVIG